MRHERLCEHRALSSGRLVTSHDVCRGGRAGRRCVFWPGSRAQTERLFFRGRCATWSRTARGLSRPPLHPQPSHPSAAVEAKRWTAEHAMATCMPVAQDGTDHSQISPTAKVARLAQPRQTHEIERCPDPASQHYQAPGLTASPQMYVYGTCTAVTCIVASPPEPTSVNQRVRNC
jgi:hypothetical protein